MRLGVRVMEEQNSDEAGWTRREKSGFQTPLLHLNNNKKPKATQVVTCKVLNLN